MTCPRYNRASNTSNLMRTSTRLSSLEDFLQSCKRGKQKPEDQRVRVCEHLCSVRVCMNICVACVFV